MRFAAALSTAAFLVGGCAYGADKELEADVMKIAPTGAEVIECAWEKNWGLGSGGGDTEASHECFFGAQGDVVSAANDILMNAGIQGFTVWCDGTLHRLEIAGVNGKKTVFVQVLERGFTNAQSISAADVEIPAGQVLVDIRVEKRKSPSGVTGRRCVPSPRR
jgi:hypothetical protein